MSFRGDTYISPIMIRVYKNTASSKGQKVKINKTNTAAFWNVRTKSRLFTQLADLNLADERSFIQREKRCRACKLYDAYCIVALYRELFDVCRFVKVKVKKNTVAFWNVRVMEFSINTARSKGQGQTSYPAKCVKTRRFEPV